MTNSEFLNFKKDYFSSLDLRFKMGPWVLEKNKNKVFINKEQYNILAILQTENIWLVEKEHDNKLYLLKPGRDKDIIKSFNNFDDWREYIELDILESEPYHLHDPLSYLIDESQIDYSQIGNRFTKMLKLIETEDLFKDRDFIIKYAGEDIQIPTNNIAIDNFLSAESERKTFEKNNNASVRIFKSFFTNNESQNISKIENEMDPYIGYLIEKSGTKQGLEIKELKPNNIFNMREILLTKIDDRPIAELIQNI